MESFILFLRTVSKNVKNNFKLQIDLKYFRGEVKSSRYKYDHKVSVQNLRLESV